VTSAGRWIVLADNETPARDGVQENDEEAGRSREVLLFHAAKLLAWDVFNK
jgi:hypothetical protein